MLERLFHLALAAILAAVVAPPPVSAALQDVPDLSDSARVSLISVLPGDDMYSLFGHSALRVRDPVTGVDRSYNFGTFDFGDSPTAMADFLARFTYGDLNYRLDVQDPVRVVAWYWEELGRASVEQTLDLTPSETREIFRRLEVNALPENRYYQYDFFFDNCATRLLDVLEGVLGPALAFEGAPDPGESFRRLLDPYLESARWVDLGMDLGLGIPADRQATPREATFLPEHLLEYLAVGSVTREGGTRPLVARTETLTGPAAAGWKPAADPPWASLAGWLLFVVGAGLTARGIRRGNAGARRWPDAVFFGLLGVGGLAVSFLWFVSLHAVTKGNFNLAWALPTHLLLAWALVRRPDAGWIGTYLAGTAALSAILVVGMPVWPQELPVALVPLLLLIVVRAGALGWMRCRPLSRPASQP